MPVTVILFFSSRSLRLCGSWLLTAMGWNCELLHVCFTPSSPAHELDDFRRRYSPQEFSRPYRHFAAGANRVVPVSIVGNAPRKNFAGFSDLAVSSTCPVCFASC